MRFAYMNRTRLTALIAVLVLVGAFSAAAPADTIPQGGGANSVVLARTSVDSEFVPNARTQVTQTGSPDVLSANIAAATATACMGCHASAVAVQAVIFTADPQVVAPQNFAISDNATCTSCGTYAYAWQYLVQVDRPFVMSGAARQQIATLRSDISATVSSIVPASVDDDALLDLELKALTSQLKATIDDAIASAGAHATAAPVEQSSVQAG